MINSDLLKISLILFVLLISNGCLNQKKNINDKLNGMWRLDKIEAFNTFTNKWVNDTTRSGKIGFIIYDGKGHMGVQMTPQGYKDFDANKDIGSLDINGLKELVKFYKSNFVYFADYKITNKTIEHNRHSASNPKDWNTVVTRDFEFRKDTLILTHLNIRLRWLKL